MADTRHLKCRDQTVMRVRVPPWAPKSNFMSNDIIKFGKALREIRLKKQLSQGDVAEKLGVHRSYISGLERGKRNPSLLTIKKMAKAIGVKPKELLEYE